MFSLALRPSFLRVLQKLDSLPFVSYVCKTRNLCLISTLFIATAFTRYIQSPHQKHNEIARERKYIGFHREPYMTQRSQPPSGSRNRLLVISDEAILGMVRSTSLMEKKNNPLQTVGSLRQS